MNEFVEKLRRTIIIQPIGCLTSYEIYQHFSNGKYMKSLKVDLFENYAIVRLRSSNIVAIALAERKYNIYGTDVVVDVPVFDPIYNDPTIYLESNQHFLPAPDKNSPSNIMNILNDHCLEMIFKHLSPRDLCAVANVCKRFRSNAQIAFKRQFSNLKLISRRDNEIIEVVAMRNNQLHFDCFCPKLIHKLFQCFGSFIKSIDLNDCRHMPSLTLLTTHFTGENNSKLTKLNFHTEKQVETKNELNAVPLMISYLKNWRNLLFKTVNENQLPVISDDDRFAQILQSNQQLKSLSVFIIDGLTLNTLRAIGSYLPKLEYLNIKYEIGEPDMVNLNENLQQLGSLSYLKVLKLSHFDLPKEFEDELFNVLANGKVPIEELTLNTMQLSSAASKLNGIKKLTLDSINIEDKLIEVINEMKSLNQLHLHYFGRDLNGNKLIEIIENAKELSILCLKSDFSIETVGLVTIDKDEFYEMVRLIKNRGNGIALKIQIAYRNIEDDEDSVLDVPDHVIEKNRQWLQIEVDEL